MKLRPIEEEFKSAAFICGGVYLLRTQDALRFVEEYRLAGIPVLGAEGFRRLGNKIQPLQEHSIDFEGEVRNSHQKMRRFLEERLDQAIWFEVVGADRRPSG